MQSVNTSIKLSKDMFYLNLMRCGEQAGLNYIYGRYYRHLAYKARKRVKCDLVASVIAQDAFLRLWTLREKISNTEECRQFLQSQINRACDSFYNSPTNAFYLRLVKMDDWEGHENFIKSLRTEPSSLNDFEHDQYIEESATIATEEQSSQVKHFLSLLPPADKHFVNLCLRFSFSFERMAVYMGGIRPWEIEKRLSNIVNTLKSGLVGIQKLCTPLVQKPIKFEGVLSDQERQIFELRCNQHKSFEEIATDLGLLISTVQNLYIEVRMMNKIKR